MDVVDQIDSFLGPSEIIGPLSPFYSPESSTWDAQRNLHPKVVARPESLESLAKLIKFLANSDLDFAIRCRGVGNASAKDVLISLSAFKDFEFRQDEGTIIVGAGHSWAEVDAKLEQVAPDYAALATRCSFAGVGGSILHGGISFLSSEHGLASDPQNLLDAQVVKLDGEVVWASEEPDLLWALRGGGACGPFGVVTTFKLRVYRHPQSVYSGYIHYPRTSLQALARGISEFAARKDPNPRTALNMFLLDPEGAVHDQDPLPGAAIHVFDANGEEHGRSEQGFKWALNIEGAVDKTVVMSMKEVNGTVDQLEAAKGVCLGRYSAIAFPEITEDIIMRAWEWLQSVITTDPKLGVGTFVLFEVMQKATFQSVSSPQDCAWPHSTSNQHILQLGIGRLDEGDYPNDIDARVLEANKNAGRMIIGETHSPKDYFPNFIQDFNDVSAVYGENYERLMEVKKKYDPRGRL